VRWWSGRRVCGRDGDETPSVVCSACSTKHAEQHGDRALTRSCFVFGPTYCVHTMPRRKGFRCEKLHLVRAEHRAGLHFWTAPRRSRCPSCCQSILHIAHLTRQGWWATAQCRPRRWGTRAAGHRSASARRKNEAALCCCGRSKSSDHFGCGTSVWVQKK
jgi:hypothetical protein